jgi:hypothetical protein
VAKARKNDVTSGFAFINMAHPDEIRQRSTQRAIRSGAMAATGRTRRKWLLPPVVVELDMRADSDAEAGGSIEIGVPTTSTATGRSSTLLGRQKVLLHPALPHLGIFAVDPDNRARELLHFSMYF